MYITPSSLVARVIPCSPAADMSVIPATSVGRERGYDNNGVEVISPDGSSKLFTHMPLDKFSLGNNSVKTIFHDKDNGMWVRPSEVRMCFTLLPL